jgi:hypothetical protein
MASYGYLMSSMPLSFWDHGYIQLALLKTYKGVQIQKGAERQAAIYGFGVTSSRALCGTMLAVRKRLARGIQLDSSWPMKHGRVSKEERPTKANQVHVAVSVDASGISRGLNF